MILEAAQLLGFPYPGIVCWETMGNKYKEDENMLQREYVFPIGTCEITIKSMRRDFSSSSCKVMIFGTTADLPWGEKENAEGRTREHSSQS